MESNCGYSTNNEEVLHYAEGHDNSKIDGSELYTEMKLNFILK